MAKKIEETKRCKIKNCKQNAVIGSMCAKHSEENDASSQVSKLTEFEAMKFGKMDAEIRNCIQGIKLIEYEINRMQTEMQIRMQQQQTERVKLNTQLESLKKDYTAYVRELADLYDMPDPAKMSIDPDTGVIRDLSEPEK